jgi:hypothetical protein
MALSRKKSKSKSILSSDDESIKDDRTILDISNQNIKDILNLHIYSNLVELYCQNNLIKDIINIPKTLKYLNCSNNLIEEIDHKWKITNLDYFNCKKNPIKKLYLSMNAKPKKYPKTLKHLIIGGQFNQPIDNLPNSITHLEISGDFNQPINNLPNSITHLEISGDFNQPIDNLPQSLSELTLGNEFNKSIDNLPPNLISLQIGEVEGNKYYSGKTKFNQPIYDLPNTLTKLSFGEESIFKHELYHLPVSLTHLTLSGNYPHSINTLPYHITNLTLGCRWFKKSDGFDAPKCCEYKIIKLPEKLEELIIYSWSYKEYEFYDLEKLNKDIKNIC